MQEVRTHDPAEDLDAGTSGPARDIQSAGTQKLLYTALAALAISRPCFQPASAPLHGGREIGG
jgi:hypothetical protein